MDPGNTVAAYYLFRELAGGGDATEAREAPGAVAAAYLSLPQAQQQKTGAPFFEPMEAQHDALGRHAESVRERARYVQQRLEELRQRAADGPAR